MSALHDYALSVTERQVEYTCWGNCIGRCSWLVAQFAGYLGAQRFFMGLWNKMLLKCSNCLFVSQIFPSNYSIVLCILDLQQQFNVFCYIGVMINRTLHTCTHSSASPGPQRSFTGLWNRMLLKCLNCFFLSHRLFQQTIV